MLSTPVTYNQLDMPSRTLTTMHIYNYIFVLHPKHKIVNQHKTGKTCAISNLTYQISGKGLKLLLYSVHILQFYLDLIKLSKNSSQKHCIPFCFLYNYTYTNLRLRLDQGIA